MPKIFVSYAEEDGRFAHEIIAFIKSNLGIGWEISDWQDPSQRGYQWINKIEKDISEANAFLALVSPHYLTSPWCIHERNMALRRDVEFQKVGNKFLWAAEVIETEKIGFFAGYDWINLIDSGWEERLRKSFIEKLNQMENGGSKPLVTQTLTGTWPTFQNRRQELNDIIANLTNVAGDHFWQIISAPQMGKSWLLQRLTIELTEKESWHIVQVDLRNQSIDARSSLVKLLSILFNQKIQGLVDEQLITSISIDIVRRKKKLLVLLDSAELLSDQNARQLRECLSQIHDFVFESGVEQAQLAFIAATRYPIRGWLGVVPSHRFESRTLSHFPISIIEKFLRETAELDGRNKDEEWFKKYSRQLSKASEGLPGLLVSYLGWIRDNEYILGSHSIESRKLFELLGKPYIDEHLLSAHSLLPSVPESNLIEPCRAVLQKTLLGLSTYRCFNEKTLHQFFEENQDLFDALEKAEWTPEQLWNTLRRTYLLEPSVDIWVRLYPSVRKLLFRYHNLICEEQIDAHHKALEFYRENQITLTGTDKAIIILEQLWHQAEYQRLSNPKSDPSSLVDFARDLFKNGIQSNHHTDRDLGVLIDERLLSDQELQESLAEIEKDLFNKIISIISQYIS